MPFPAADLRNVAINPARPPGHRAAAGATAPENEFQNREIGAFLDVVTERGGKIQ